MTAQPALDASRAPEVLPGVVGTSEELKAAAGPVALIAESEVACLLTGETGAGKELFARAIHSLSARRHKPFVPVNCGAIPNSMIETELFGQARGVYAGEPGQRAGVLAHAEGGTVFLAEVDALSAGAQVKLLRALQHQEYRPVGSARIVRMNVRVLAATNKDLPALVEARRFREDLFYRINALRINVPALRDHAADIPALAEHFTREYAAKHRRPAMGLDAGAIDRLATYGWPGNVRELQGVLERAVLLSSNARLTSADLDLPDGARQPSLPLRAAKDRAIAQFERKYLSEVLHRCGGNISRAAQAAGKERRTFQRLMRKYQLSGATFRPCQS